MMSSELEPISAPGNPLPQFLACFVPLRVADLQRRGGPEDWEEDAALAFVIDVVEQGDVLLYGGAPGEAGRLAARLVQTIAVLAFAPGGITIFGQHWEGTATRPQPQEVWQPGTGRRRRNKRKVQP